MRRGAALVLLLVTVVVLRRAMTGDGAADLRGTALAFGFALIAASVSATFVPDFAAGSSRRTDQ